MFAFFACHVVSYGYFSLRVDVSPLIRHYFSDVEKSFRHCCFFDASLCFRRHCCHAACHYCRHAMMIFALIFILLDMLFRLFSILILLRRLLFFMPFR